MCIGSIDKIATERLQKKIKRKSKCSTPFTIDLSLNESVASTSGLSSTKRNSWSNTTSSDSNHDYIDDVDFKWSYPLEKIHTTKATVKTMGQMRMNLTHTAAAADLTGISSRNVAKITTAVLEDMNLVSASDSVRVIDKNKIRREVAKNRKQIRQTHTINLKSIGGLYFDGRKDQTMSQIEGRRVIIAEEHIALIEEPGGKYLGHLSLVPAVKAVDIKNGLVSFIKKQ